MGCRHPFTGLRRWHPFRDALDAVTAQSLAAFGSVVGIGNLLLDRSSDWSEQAWRRRAPASLPIPPRCSALLQQVELVKACLNARALWCSANVRVTNFHGGIFSRSTA